MSNLFGMLFSWLQAIQAEAMDADAEDEADDTAPAAASVASKGQAHRSKQTASFNKHKPQARGRDRQMQQQRQTPEPADSGEMQQEAVMPLTSQSSDADGASAAALRERARTISSTGYQEADPSELQGSAAEADNALDSASTAATEAAAKPSKKAGSGAKPFHKAAPARHASSTSLASSAVGAGAAALKKHGSAAAAAAAAEGIDAVSASEGRRLSTSSALDWDGAEAADSVAAKRTAGTSTRTAGSKPAAGSTGVRQRKLTRQSDADGYGGAVAGGGHVTPVAASACSAVPEEGEQKVRALQFGRHSSSDDAGGDTGTDDYTHRSRVSQVGRDEP